MKYSIDAILSRDPQLTSLPDIVYKLNDMVINPRTTADDFANVIIQDTALTARLLKIVNSPFYNFPNQVSTITMAITIIGVRALRDLVLTTAVVQKYNKVPADLINPESFWRHSICTGLAAKAIGIRIKVLNSEQMFVMGILHDIGRLIMALVVPDEIRKIMQRVETSQESIEEAEFIVLGFDHTALGSELAERWGMPECLYGPVRHHHAPMRAQSHMQEAAVLHVANEVAYAIEQGTCYKPRQNFDQTVLELLKLGKEDFEQLIETIAGELDPVVRALHISQAA